MTSSQGTPFTLHWRSMIGTRSDVTGVRILEVQDRLELSALPR